MVEKSSEIPVQNLLFLSALLHLLKRVGEVEDEEFASTRFDVR